MKSPFPGMDPYLEEHWTDVHSTLVVYAREVVLALQPLVARAYGENRFDIDYDQPCQPNLADDDAPWAATLLDAWQKVG